MRAVALALAALCAVPVLGAAAVVVVPPVPEQLVEGHTVFTVIQSPVTDDAAREEYAAAVAVLVRETNLDARGARFPGVLWFNDQYLVAPVDDGPDSGVSHRHPCKGAVLAVNRGDPDPRTLSLTDADYNESYLVTDPLDRRWTIDKWNVSGTYVWVVGVTGPQGGGDDASRSQADDGTSDCGAFTDEWSDEGESCVRSPFTQTSCVEDGVVAASGRVRDPGEHGMGYPCEGCPRIRYNALLYFLLSDLDVEGPAKNHAEGAQDLQDDASGCHAGYSPGNQSWPCPDDDDDREGNSHPYNPTSRQPGGYPFNRVDGTSGYHGKSDDCDGDGRTDLECHATRAIDIYYGWAPAPTVRRYALEDLEGSTAPYHCHEAAACRFDDYASPEAPSPP
ncbi:MAG TPA: hypothetical protein VHH36_00280 [Candidatus Thermoplasmatota archaeon]|nr:hypothetical protein [Candidatus Thermoplasmatota archaeon]